MPAALDAPEIQVPAAPYPEIWDAGRLNSVSTAIQVGLLDAYRDLLIKMSRGATADLRNRESCHGGNPDP